MSGIGKTSLCEIFEKAGRIIYSVDERIAKKLKPFLNGETTRENLSALSEFLNVSHTDRGLFRQRQKLYSDLETEVTLEIAREIRQHNKACIIDTSGSFCEISKKQVIDDIGQQSLIVYLHADNSMKEELIRRAIAYPKPIFYPAGFIEAVKREYIDRDLSESFEEFLFSRLLEVREKKYQKIVNDYSGITISVSLKQ